MEVALSTVLSPQFIRHSENKYICAILLHIAKSDKKPLEIFEPKGYGSFAKKARYGPEAGYDRISYLAEVNTRNTFVIITSTSVASQQLLRSERNALHIGCIVHVKEPIF